MRISSWSRFQDVGRIAILFVSIFGITKAENANFRLCGVDSCAAVDKSLSYLWDGSTNMCTDPYSTVCSHNSFQPDTVYQFIDEKWDHYKSAEYAYHDKEYNILREPTEDSTVNHAHKFFMACVRDEPAEQEEENYKAVLADARKIVDANPVAKLTIVQPEGYDFAPDPTKPWWRNSDKYYLAQTGESIIHHFSYAVNYEKAKNVLIMTPPDNTIPKQTLLDLERAADCAQSHREEGNRRTTYANYIIETLSDVYSDVDYTAWWTKALCQKIDKIIDFEIKLANISFAENEIRFSLPLGNPPNFTEWSRWYENQLMYHDYSLNDGVKWIESPILHFARSLELEPDPLTINWEIWISDLWQTILRRQGITDRSISTSLVEVPNKTYYLKLSVLLRTSSPKAIVDYMHWKFLRDSAIRTKKGAKKFEKVAKKMGFEKKLKKPSWLRCVEENALKDVVHQKIMQAETQISEISKNIRTIYDGLMMGLVDRQILQPLYRANGDEILENHVNEMTINIYGDNTLLTDDLSRDLPERPATSNYYSEYQSQQKWRTKNALSKLGTDSNGKIWPVSPDKAAIFVTTTPHRHQLFIPAAMLQKPFFDLNQDKFRNYAGIGAEIATALWHSAIFPATFPETTYQWGKHCSPLKSVFDPDKISEETERRIFQSGKQAVDAVQIALEAYTLEGRYEDDNGLGYMLQNSEKQAFIAAYMSTQCESINSYAPSSRWEHGISGTKPALDSIGLRNIGTYYSFKDDSTAKFRMDSIGQSWFFNDVFLCPRVVDKINC